MQIRPGEQTDRQQILEVHTSAIRLLCDEHYTAAELAAWSERLQEDSYERVIRERKILVAVEDNLVVGFGQIDASTGEVEAIYVRPAAARLGVGSRLLSQLENVARHRGLAELFLDSSLNAVPFYTRAGFRSIEHRVHRLESDLEIACVRMTKRLNLLA